MAKRVSKRSAPGMFEVAICGLDEMKSRSERERELQRSLDWLRKLHDKIERRFPAGSPFPKNSREVGYIQLKSYASELLDDATQAKPYPVIVRLAWHLGRIYEQLRLEIAYDDLIVKGRVSSQTGREKAILRGKKNLGPADWNKVQKYIKKSYDGGVTIKKSCELAARQLNTGTFVGVSRRVDLSGEALRKRWNNRRK